MTPSLHPDDSHHDPELQAYVGNRFADPWSRLEPLLHLMLIALAFPAITLLVFLRPKLGFRVPKPWILVTAFHWLLFLALLVNLVPYGWVRLKRDTPVGDYLAQLHARPLLPRLPMTQRPKAERWKMPGFPDNWWDLTDPQKREWAQQHPREYQTSNAALYKREQDLAAKEAAEDEKALADAAAQAKADKERPFLPHLSLAIFAGAMLVVGLWRRYEGKQLIRQKWHSMSRGESYLARLLPVSEYAVQTYVEPGLIILLAIPFAFVSISLSLWLVYAAVTVWASEMIVMELMINRVLDQFDGEVEGRQLQEARRLLKENAKQQRVAKTAGVRAAAFSDDIQAALGMSTNA